MSHNRRTIFFIIASVFLVGAVFTGGVFIGYANRPEVEKVTTIFNKEADVTTNISAETDFSPFWKTWDVINKKYAGGDGVTTDQEKVWGAIQGLVGSLDDPYSVFMPPEEAQTFEENISGNFGGIGIEIGIRDDILTVIAPLKDTPAYHAGLLAGDKIIAVGGTSTVAMRVDEAVRLIRGEIGTPIVLTIARKENGDPFDVRVLRDTITIPTSDTEKRSDGIFVIKLYNFSAASPNLFRNALREFVLSGYSKLIFDIRGNPGGYLQAAVDVSSWFLPAGKVVVTEDYAGKRDNVIHRSVGYNIFNDNLKMVILVDQGSASASEIVAGALSEHGIATLVGEKTFGKGSVQELEKITSDSSLKITVAHWMTPNGNSISKNGLTPHHEIPVTHDDREAGKDPQLDKAVEILLNE